MKSSLAVLVLALGACATAGGGGGDDDDDGTLTPDASPPDASEIIPTDAAAPDAGPMAVTLSQNNATNLVAGNSVACQNTTTGFTRENSYYRVFPLASAGVTGQYTATSVTFGIESSTAHSAEVKLHTLDGAFTRDNLTTLRTQSVSIAPVPVGTPQPLTVTLTTPVVVPAGSTLVVEVHSPDLEPQSGSFFMGSNTAGESATGYTFASACGDQEPITMAEAGAPTMHIVLTVSGTTP